MGAMKRNISFVAPSHDESSSFEEESVTSAQLDIRCFLGPKVHLKSRFVNREGVKRQCVSETDAEPLLKLPGQKDIRSFSRVMDFEAAEEAARAMGLSLTLDSDEVAPDDCFESHLDDPEVAWLEVESAHFQEAYEVAAVSMGLSLGVEAQDTIPGEDCEDPEVAWCAAEAAMGDESQEIGAMSIGLSLGMEAQDEIPGEEAEDPERAWCAAEAAMGDESEEIGAMSIGLSLGMDAQDETAGEEAEDPEAAWCAAEAAMGHESEEVAVMSMGLSLGMEDPQDLFAEGLDDAEDPEKLWHATEVADGLESEEAAAISMGLSLAPAPSTPPKRLLTRSDTAGKEADGREQKKRHTGEKVANDKIKTSDAQQQQQNRFGPAEVQAF